MSNHEQQQSDQLITGRKAVGWVLIVVSLAIAKSVMTMFEPNLRGGLLLYLVGPPIFALLWASLSSIFAGCLLRRSHGRPRSMAAIGYGFIIATAAFGIWLGAVFNNPFAAPTYHGP